MTAEEMLSRALAASGMTQRQLARKSGVTFPNVHGILRGKRKRGPWFSTLVALLDACGFELKMEKKQ